MFKHKNKNCWLVWMVPPFVSMQNQAREGGMLRSATGWVNSCWMDVVLGLLTVSPLNPRTVCWLLHSSPCGNILQQVIHALNSLAEIRIKVRNLHSKASVGPYLRLVCRSFEIIDGSQQIWARSNWYYVILALHHKAPKTKFLPELCLWSRQRHVMFLGLFEDLLPFSSLSSICSIESASTKISSISFLTPGSPAKILSVTLLKWSEVQESPTGALR